MMINANSLVSISEANEDFSRVARMVDETGAAVILKNNMPRYIVLEYSQFENDDFVDTQTREEIGERIVKQHLHAFKELAK